MLVFSQPTYLRQRPVYDRTGIPTVPPGRCTYVTSDGLQDERLYSVLSRFFSEDEYRSFRSIQKHIGVAVSGSVALRFFDSDATQFDSQNLDLYVPNHFGQEFARWLFQHGYTYNRRRNIRAPSGAIGRTVNRAMKHPFVSYDFPGLTHTLSQEGFLGFFEFSKLVEGEDRQIIVALGPVMSIILRFHSSEYTSLVFTSGLTTQPLLTPVIFSSIPKPS